MSWVHRKLTSAWSVFCLPTLFLLTQSTWAQMPQNQKDLTWMIGKWSGSRVDQADGSHGDMELEVRSVLDGA